VRPFHLASSPNVLEQFPKSVTRFSDKSCGKNKKIEQSGKPSEPKTALDDVKVVSAQSSQQPLQKPLLSFKKSVADKIGDIFQSSQSLPQNHALPLMDSKDRKKIERGLVKMEARLDLHGLDSARAHALLLQFISHAALSGKKHVLIITGKGHSFKNGADKNGRLRQEESARLTGVLRQSVPLWLETAPFRSYVSAVEEAARHHGGAGALYVRLRRQKGRQKGAPKGALLR